MPRKSSRERKRRREKKLKKWRAGLKPKGPLSLVDRAAATLGVPRGKLVPMIGSGPKLSQRIWELIEPYGDGVHDDEMAKRLVDTGILAWNLALFPADERQIEMKEMVRKLSRGDAELYAAGISMFSALIERKLALFPDDGRMVAEYELLPTETGWHLNVAALMSPDDYDGGNQPPMPSDGPLGPPG